MLRDNALGNFRDILVNIAKDGDALLARRPDEHEGKAAGELRREVMELFSMGVGHYVETDVYAAALCSPDGTCGDSATRTPVF